jgi:hypothetical protein
MAVSKHCRQMRARQARAAKREIEERRALLSALCMEGILSLDCPMPQTAEALAVLPKLSGSASVPGYLSSHWADNTMADYVSRHGEKVFRTAVSL